MLVRVEHISKSIQKNTILNDVSLGIEDYGVIGLLGPNGAGKSTLMKCMVGLWDFQEGEIEICGIKSVEKDKRSRIMPHEVTKKTGYLPELNPLYGDMYVREYLRFMQTTATEGRLHSNESREQQIEELIEKAGLSGMANKRIRELSKGYKQRVGIAQALTGESEILILDEPTTGLDPNQLIETRELIRELGKTKVVILSTHILQEVKAMCSRVVILAKGEIRYDSTDLSNIEEIFTEKTNHE